MITVPFILSHYSSSYWYKNSLLLSGLTAVYCSIRVDRKRLYMCKKGAFWVGFRSRPLKIDTSVDEDIECQS